MQMRWRKTLRGIDSWSFEISLIINVFQFYCIINIRSEIFSVSRDILTVLYETEYNQSNECYKEKLRIRSCVTTFQQIISFMEFTCPEYAVSHKTLSTSYKYIHQLYEFFGHVKRYVCILLKR